MLTAELQLYLCSNYWNIVKNVSHILCSAVKTRNSLSRNWLQINRCLLGVFLLLLKRRFIGIQSFIVPNSLSALNSRFRKMLICFLETERPFFSKNDFISIAVPASSSPTPILGFLAPIPGLRCQLEPWLAF